MNKGKKMLKRVLCLLAAVSMLSGFQGCAMLLQYAQEYSVDTKNSATDKEEERENNPSSLAEENEQKETSKEQQKKEEVPVANDSIVKDVLEDEAFLDKLELIGELVDQCYLNGVSKEDVQEAMFRGLLAGLGDPYSGYYTEEEYKELMESSNGIYCGIGATVQQSMETMLITIIKPFVDGPAYKAGMLPGDIVYMVDGMDVTGMDINNVVAMMKGEAGTIVQVTVMRNGEQVDLTITRDFVEVETITHEMLDNKIGLITITEFDEVTIQQFKDAVDGLKADGMKGLVIDLRDNPGGLLNAVVDMLEYILPDGLIVYTEDKYGEREEYYGKDKNELKLPIAVLVNGNSASASEIFASAMQDYEAATIVGTTSFGKGIVQSIYPLNWVASQLRMKGFEDDGSAVKVTISYYYTPKGRCIHGTGVTPDVEVELDEALRQQVVIEKEQDNQLNAAIEVLMEKIK